jgi:hypothetical protein
MIFRQSIKIAIVFTIIPALSILNYCKKGSDLNPDPALLKTKYWFQTKNDSIPLCTYIYHYDDRKNLVRLNHFGKNTDFLLAYDLFEYGMDNKLKTKYSFHSVNDSIGWRISDSTHFLYEEGQLTSEITYIPPPYKYQVSIYYDYDGSKLIKMTRYDHRGFAYCIEYLYENEVCVKEIRYSDLAMENMSGYTKHFYVDRLRTRTERYTSQAQNFQVITYEYDINDNLITEESVPTDFPVSKPVAYYYLFEYY